VTTSPPPAEPLALRVNDACRAAGIGKTKLYSLAKEGRLRLIKLDGRTVVPISELRRLLGEVA